MDSREETTVSDLNSSSEPVKFVSFATGTFRAFLLGKAVNFTSFGPSDKGIIELWSRWSGEKAVGIPDASLIVFPTSLRCHFDPACMLNL